MSLAIDKTLGLMSIDIRSVNRMIVHVMTQPKVQANELKSSSQKWLTKVKYL